MTQFFLTYHKEKDEYMLRTMGLGHRFNVIKRKEGMSDEEFKNEAIRIFDNQVAQDQVIEGEIIKTAYVY